MFQQPVLRIFAHDLDVARDILDRIRSDLHLEHIQLINPKLSKNKLCAAMESDGVLGNTDIIVFTATALLHLDDDPNRFIRWLRFLNPFLTVLVIHFRSDMSRYLEEVIDLDRTAVFNERTSKIGLAEWLSRHTGRIDSEALYFARNGHLSQKRYVDITLDDGFSCTLTREHAYLVWLLAVTGDFVPPHVVEHCIGTQADPAGGKIGELLDELYEVAPEMAAFFQVRREKGYRLALPAVAHRIAMSLEAPPR